MGQPSNSASSRSLRSRVPALAAAAFVTAMLGCASGGQAGAHSETLSRELETTVARYISSWNTHDANVLAAHFDADADMIMGTGPILEGRTAIGAWWRAYFAAQEPERELTIEMLSTRSITTDVALINVRTTTGGRTDRGVELPPRRARGTWVLVHQDGQWHISSMRGMPTRQDQIIRSRG
jgi:uncharacterized protein (TIGR02246 family)